METCYPNINHQTPKRSRPIVSLQSFSKAASVAVFMIGCLVILGWKWDIALLKSILPGLVTMKANTAIGFIFSGSALWLFHQQPRKRLNFLVQVLATLVICIGLLTLIQYTFHINFAIDQLFFIENANAAGTFAPGRMGPNTASNFLLLGLALLLLTKKAYSAAHCLCITAFLVAFLGLLGYLYGITSFYGIGSYTEMALHASIAFIVLAVGILFACPKQGLMSVATSPLAGGIMLRRLCLPVIGIPPILCWLILLGKRSHFYDGEVGIALLCVLNILVLAVLIWWNAKTLGVVDYQALHDLLTGLPNRILFNDRLSVELANARRRQENLAVLFLDLDRFKKINDSLGHEMGDRLLEAVSDRLRKCLREEDTIARWGGDEFTLILPHVNSTEYAVEIAEIIIDVLRPPFSIENHYLHITSSIGICFYPQDGEDAETLIKNADVALYSAKAQGRNNYQFYTPNINQQSSELLALENRLHHALERKELAVYYQPKVNINTGRICGMEALLRWQCPEFGLISPTKFIPLAEENGLIVPIGEWVLRTACIQNKAWIDGGLSPIRIAVNLSARQLQQPNLVEMVAAILAETQLDPWFLELEITETTAMQNVEFTKEILRQLTGMGVAIAIDDFGTGYSSLNYLKIFPIHTIKIDRSFVSELTIDPYDTAIASAVLALGQGLNLNVVAEGVETSEQVECLQVLGCEEMQGFFFSQPISNQEAIALLKNYRSSIVKTS